MIEPIYDYGTWGRVIAVVHNDQRIARPKPGQTMWQPPPFDCGSVERIHPDFSDVTVTVRLGLRTPSPIPVDNTDSRISPEWAALVASGKLTPELLADLPEPVERILARAKIEATRQAEAWLAKKLTDGIPLPFASGIRRIHGAPSHLAQLKALLDSHLTVGTSELSPVVITDTTGAPIITSVGELKGLQGPLLAEVERLRGAWASMYAAIQSATTLDAIPKVDAVTA